MPTPLYHLPYGTTRVAFRLPGGLTADRAVSRRSRPLAEAAAAVRQALAAPLGSPPLAALANPRSRVCIIFTDATRACPDALLVGALLAELERAGVPDQQVTLLCGTGMHRPSTPEEKVAKLGAELVRRFRVIDHEPQNPAVLVDLGVTAGGVPVQIHRAAVEADLLVATGVVEPHQYAGYSGGAKTAAVGAAGEALIAHTHGPAFIDDPRTRLGRIDDNPFQAAIQEAGRRAGLRFVLNVVLDDQERLLRVAAGEPGLTHRTLVEFARSIYEVPVPHAYDLVLAGVGHPKDSNLYQASRAASYLFFAPRPVVRPGGFLVIPARCEEGAGQGVGEQRFLAAMRSAASVGDILEQGRREGYPPGQQRAFVMAKVLEQVRVVIVGSESPQLVSDCKMIPCARMEDALALAARELRERPEVLIVPRALHTLPIVPA